MAQISGTTGDDTITPSFNSDGGPLATNGPDNIFAGTGADSVDGGGGDDMMDGWSGADTLNGELGNDLVFGYDGDDFIADVGGEDTLYGEAGNDSFDLNGVSDIAGSVIDGGADYDTVDLISGTLQLGSTLPFVDIELLDTFLTEFVGTGGNDSYDFRPFARYSEFFGLPLNIQLLSAGAGADTVFAGDEDLTALLRGSPSGQSFNKILGEAGDDSLIGGASFDHLDGGANNDTLEGGGGADSLYGGAGGDDSLVGGDGADTLDGGGGRDSAFGGEGDDYIFAVFGAAEVIVGGNGADTLDTTSFDGNYVVNLATGATNYAGESFTEMEHIISGDGADTLTGSAVANRMLGGLGADSILGAGGADTLEGGAGADTLAGGLDNDLYVVGTGDVLVESGGGGGADTVVAEVNWTLTANFEQLQLIGSAATGTGNGLSNIMTGNALDNTLNGAAGADTLSGGDGGDSLIGGTGADSLAGGAGNDTFGVDDDGDALLELGGGGIDLVQSSLDYALGSQLENLTLTGNLAVSATGNGLNNVITGNNLANILIGAGGADTLIGQNGNDFLNGGTGGDSMQGGLGADRYVVESAGDAVIEAADAGNDTIIASIDLTLADNLEGLTLTGTALDGTGNALTNRITGNAGANLLRGLAGTDVLLGLDGADTPVGGTGADRLQGGVGADIFLFNDSLEGADRIGDFAPGEDRIGVLGTAFGGLAPGALGAPNFVAHASNAATSASGVPQFIYNTVTGTLNYDGDGAGGVAGIRLAVLAAAPALTATDILIV